MKNLENQNDEIVYEKEKQEKIIVSHTNSIQNLENQNDEIKKSIEIIDNKMNEQETKFQTIELCCKKMKSQIKKMSKKMKSIPLENIQIPESIQIIENFPGIESNSISPWNKQNSINFSTIFFNL